MSIGSNQHFLTAFNDIVERYPNNDAVVTDGNEIVSYQELQQRALHIADTLKSHDIEHEEVIGLHISKSADYLASALGCWYAGVAFMPLDPTLPDQRRDYILDDSKTNFIISNKENNVGLNSEKQSILLIEDLNLEQGGYTPPNVEQDLKSLAYVIYTSGSTGTPKGVEVTHEGLVPMLDAQIEAFQLDHTSRSLFYLSTNFDASVSDIGTALLSGAALHIETRPPQEIAANLTNIVEERGITYIDIPPSVLRIIDSETMPKTLKSITIGGEILDPKIVQEWAEKFRLINVYGPTEATVCTSLVVCDYQKWDTPTIGYPLPEVLYKVVNDEMKSVSVGGSGELLIGGKQLARGYLNRPDLNAEKFIELDGNRYYRSGDKVQVGLNNEIEFIGRIDRQVKVRGQLVELEEIESNILKNTSIGKAAVVKRPFNESDQSNQGLIAFITAKDKIDIIELKTELEETLSPWMIPSHFEVIDGNMPQTVTGKIDYSALEKLPLTMKGNSYDQAELSPREKQIKELWSRILQTSDFGVHDNFNDVGGNSLKVIELSMLAELGGLAITPNLLYENPTIAGLAQWIEDNPKFESNEATTSAMDAQDLRDKVALNAEWHDLISKARTLPEAQTNQDNIFVTGANGFLASRLIHELLTHSDSNIFALVRASDDQAAMNRLESAFVSHGLQLTDKMKERITPIIGDISKSKMGMNDEDWDTLANTVDSVVHSAAIVNMTAPYEALEGANVFGTQETARLALTGRRKKLHYTSTLSVFVSTDQNTGDLLESDVLENTQIVYGGYGQTKWAAEYFLHQIPADVCDMSIHRLGLITGDTLSGKSSEKDFLNMFVQGVTQLGAVPDGDANAIEVDATPIDYCAEAMRHIILTDETEAEDHKVFHIANTRGFSLEQILNNLRWRGYQIDTLSPEVWEQKMDGMRRKGFNVQESAAYFAIMRMLPNQDVIDRHVDMDLFQATGVNFDQINTQAVLKNSGIILPPPDTNLLDTYLDSITGHKKEISKRGAQTMRSKTGLILGKFMPPHKGHFHLINFARNYPGVDKLTVVVDRIPDAPIPQAQIVKWISQEFPDVTVVPLGDYNYQDPSFAPDDKTFWDQWEKSLKSAVPDDIDYCFNSEDYGWKLAEVLGVTHVPVDRGRENFPISGTQMRKDPFTHWDQLPKVVRPYFTKKVAVIGPESTGKSTMAINLAKHFNTKVVPEYARLFLEALAEKQEPRSTDLGDIPIFADGQMASEASLLGEANRVLICDTEPLTTKVWSQTLYDTVPPEVEEHVEHANYDLYVLTNPDVPWVDDTHRWEEPDKQERREEFYRIMKGELDNRHLPYIEISGEDFDDRFNQAKEAVEDRIFRGRTFSDFGTN